VLIKDLKECKEMIAGDNTALRELLNPLKEDICIRYSLAHTRLKPGQKSLAHRLKSSEVYYIIQGRGEIYIGDQKENVSAGQALYIPPDAVQKIKNTGTVDLTFLCIVDPAWKPEDEKVIE
jgi:mannose-6-phosphate isomerase-like protein (cupin superfamily)